MDLSVYKKGQGTAARGVAGVVAVVVGLWAAHQTWATFHNALMWIRVLVTGLVAMGFGGVPLYLVLRHHRVVDLLIETQQEMRKVAWSTRAEVVGSTIVVIVTVALLALFILGMDLVIWFLFRQVLGLY